MKEYFKIMARYNTEEFRNKEKYWFPLKEDPMMGDLVWREKDERCEYWTSVPMSLSDAEEMGGNIKIMETAY